jgi:hypothetical protein
MKHAIRAHFPVYDASSLAPVWSLVHAIHPLEWPSCIERKGIERLEKRKKINQNILYRQLRWRLFFLEVGSFESLDCSNSLRRVVCKKSLSKVKGRG